MPRNSSLLLNQKIQQHVHKTLSLVPILTHLNPVEYLHLLHIRPSDLFEIYDIHLILPSYICSCHNGCVILRNIKTIFPKYVLIHFIRATRLANLISLTYSKCSLYASNSDHEPPREVCCAISSSPLVSHLGPNTFFGSLF